MKYIIELDEIPNTGLYKAKGANTLVFDKNGIKNILKPYKEEPEIDWNKVPIDTPILVRDFEDEDWTKRHFAKFELGVVHAWESGATSWTSDVMIAWKYAKLAEEGDE